jgi:glycosyltransferase involved in cell wall biosynthesis
VRTLSAPSVIPRAHGAYEFLPAWLGESRRCAPYTAIAFRRIHLSASFVRSNHKSGAMAVLVLVRRGRPLVGPETTVENSSVEHGSRFRKAPCARIGPGDADREGVGTSAQEAERGFRILHVIGSVDPRGGGTTDHVFSSSQVWSEHKHECHILCLDPPDAECVRRSPLTTFALGDRGRLSDIARRLPLLRYGYTPRLVRWLEQNVHRYDAVILNGLWNYTSYGSWQALRTRRVPYYIFPHGMLDPWLKEAHPVNHFLRSVFWRLFEWKVVRDCGEIFFACEEESRLAHQHFLRGSRRGRVGGFGTRELAGDRAAQRSAFLSKFPQLRGRKIILFLSRIHPKKGLDLLIRAFARHARTFQEFDLVIAGPDGVGLKTHLMRLCADLKVEPRVHWTGMLTGDDKWGAFRSASFFVLPSHQENFGIAVVEAMALAVPVLITRKVNIWREVESCGAGRAVADDVKGIAEGLEYMCAVPPPRLAAMAQNARNCFIERFDLEKNALEILELMRSPRQIERDPEAAEVRSSRRRGPSFKE